MCRFVSWRETVNRRTVQMLDLLRPNYENSAAYGHFGREEPEFTWKNNDKATALRAGAGL
jgi:S-adenosylmethionine synthetase